MKTVGILSFKNKSIALMPACLRLELHLVLEALALAAASDGKSSAARIAIIAITTSNSTRVKPREEPRRLLINGFLAEFHSTVKNVLSSHGGLSISDVPCEMPLTRRSLRIRGC